MDLKCWEWAHDIHRVSEFSTLGIGRRSRDPDPFAFRSEARASAADARNAMLPGSGGFSPFGSLGARWKPQMPFDGNAGFENQDTFRFEQFTLERSVGLADEKLSACPYDSVPRNASA